jgi:hypothetical protein
MKKVVMHSEVACIMAILAMVLAGSVLAAITPEEAAQLGKNLTALGAEKAGNADGTIPEYTGGMRTPPAGYVSGSGKWPDPYADEKPLFSIDAQNVDKYADKLPEGVKEAFKVFPDFRMDIYPTHRSFWVPKWVEENTIKSATKARTSDNGLSLKDVRAAVPFPIPKTAEEVMWNHLVQYHGLHWSIDYSAYLVDRNGRKIDSADLSETWEYPYWDPSSNEFTGYRQLAIFNGPPRMVGEKLLVLESINPIEAPRKVWQYLPGQRRVKLAPEIAFDTLNLACSGMMTYDETFLFNGSMELYNWKIVGKKEMYVPYNMYKSLALKLPDWRGYFFDPSFYRFELHRVWIIEATLKEGKRHLYHKRLWYIDEDSWAALVATNWDASGKLWRAQFDMPWFNYEDGGIHTNQGFIYDLIGHATFSTTGGTIKYYKTRMPPSDLNPDSMAGSGVR